MLKKKTKKIVSNTEIKFEKKSSVPAVQKATHDSHALVPVKSSQALTAIDPLRRYLAEVRAYPFLTDEQERALALKVRDEHDPQAAKLLVASHLRLVAKIAMEYRSAYYNLIDLIQEGNVGLLVAVQKYDLDKGARFSSYATWWIRSYILKYILDNFRLIRIGTTKEQRKLFFNLVQEKQKIEAMGFAPKSEYLASRLGVTVQQLDDMNQRMSQPELALEAPVSHDDGKSATFGDFIADDDVPIDEKISKAEMSDALATKMKEFVGELNERDAQIFQERLLSEVPRTLQDIADEYGITKERVRQLESRVLKKLKDHLQAAGIDQDWVPA